MNTLISKEVGMANITVRDLPDKAKETLRVHVVQVGISLEVYAPSQLIFFTYGVVLIGFNMQNSRAMIQCLRSCLVFR